jgi:two-component system sensor histidine kinase VicK
VAIALAQQPGHVLLSVADEGVGIPERLHPVLFDRFTKARRPGLRGEKSTGLGMFITRALVERHGGRIWFESREGAGTTFYVQLPVHGPV